MQRVIDENDKISRGLQHYRDRSDHNKVSANSPVSRSPMDTPMKLMHTISFDTCSHQGARAVPTAVRRRKTPTRQEWLKRLKRRPPTTDPMR